MHRSTAVSTTAGRCIKASGNWPGKAGGRSLIDPEKRGGCRPQTAPGQASGREFREGSEAASRLSFGPYGKKCDIANHETLKKGPFDSGLKKREGGENLRQHLRIKRHLKLDESPALDQFRGARTKSKNGREQAAGLPVNEYSASTAPADMAIPRPGKTLSGKPEKLVDYFTVGKKGVAYPLSGHINYADAFRKNVHFGSFPPRN